MTVPRSAAPAAGRSDQLAQPQDVLGVDRVGIAQPGLDLGDRELHRPRVARRLGLGLWGSFDLRGLVELAGPSGIACASLARLLPSLRAGHGGKPLQKRDVTVGAPEIFAA